MTPKNNLKYIEEITEGLDCVIFPLDDIPEDIAFCNNYLYADKLKEERRLCHKFQGNNLTEEWN